MNIADILNIETIKEIVTYASGKIPTKMELEDTEIEFWENSCLYEDYETQQMIIPLYDNDINKNVIRKVIIYKNGLVRYESYSGVNINFYNPIKLYKIISKYEQEFNYFNENY